MKEQIRDMNQLVGLTIEAIHEAPYNEAGAMLLSNGKFAFFDYLLIYSDPLFDSGESDIEDIKWLIDTSVVSREEYDELNVQHDKRIEDYKKRRHILTLAALKATYPELADANILEEEE